MPGGYSDVPGARLAYDLDGTLAFRIGSDHLVAAEITPLNTATLNHDFNATTVIQMAGAGRSPDAFCLFLFPGPREIYGVHAGGQFGGPHATPNFFLDVATSEDAHTVDGGSWTVRDSGTVFTPGAYWLDGWRRYFATFSASNVWGLRGRVDGGTITGFTKLTTVHIYGQSTDPERLVLLDAGTGLEIGAEDWGYLPRGVTKSRVLQVRNTSTSQTAEDVTVSFDSLNGYSDDWYQVRDGAGAYASSVNLGNLGPSVTHANDITIKVTIPDGAELGPSTARAKLSVSGWS